MWPGDLALLVSLPSLLPCRAETACRMKGVLGRNSPGQWRGHVHGESDSCQLLKPLRHSPTVEPCFQELLHCPPAHSQPMSDFMLNKGACTDILGCWNKCHKLCGLNNRNILSRSSVVWKFKIKASAGLVSYESCEENIYSSFSPWLVDSHLNPVSLHNTFPVCVSLSLNFSFL